jgi:hypothetical protein
VRKHIYADEAEEETKKVEYGSRRRASFKMRSTTKRKAKAKAQDGYLEKRSLLDAKTVPVWRKEKNQERVPQDEVKDEEGKAEEQ